MKNLFYYAAYLIAVYSITINTIAQERPQEVRRQPFREVRTKNNQDPTVYAALLKAREAERRQRQEEKRKADAALREARIKALHARLGTNMLANPKFKKFDANLNGVLDPRELDNLIQSDQQTNTVKHPKPAPAPQQKKPSTTSKGEMTGEGSK
ncbi:MAG: hypothetical protein ACO1QB_06750 [Verrucomicrobiales bacterium]